MSLLLNQRETVKHFIYSDSEEDDYGNPVAGFTQSDDLIALVSHGNSDEPDEGNRDRISAEFTLNLDYDTPLSERDEVEVRGYRCVVEGLVQRWINPRTGRKVGAVAHVRWTEG